MNELKKSIESKKQMIKSTGIVGSAQVFTVLLQILRTKIIAYLLGPAGVGLLGILNSIVDMVRNATGMGINFSGVREISQAVATQDIDTLSRKVQVLKSWAIFTGIIGAVILLVFCVPICKLTFQDDSYLLGVASLSIAVFLTSISQSQVALLQGTRNLASMAKASVIGVFLSIIIVTPIYYIWGMNGMIPAVILMAMSSFLLSYYYVSKLQIPIASISIGEIIQSGKEMILLGFASAISGIITTLSMYYIRSFISSQSSIESVGYFQASWSISNVYLLSVLNAMAADFFPRLSAVNKEKEKVNKLVNEQTEIALLIGGPIIVCMFTFSSLIIKILYSAEFVESIFLLNYFVIGSFFKLLSWPICIILGAKGAFKQILISETSWNIIFVGLSILFWNSMNLKGIGISYIISYVLYIIILFILVRPLTKFKWSSSIIRHILYYSFMLLGVVLIYILCRQYIYCGIFFVFISLLYSYKYLKAIIDIKNVFKKLFKKTQ